MTKYFLLVTGNPMSDGVDLAVDLVNANERLAGAFDSCRARKQETEAVAFDFEEDEEEAMEMKELITNTLLHEAQVGFTCFVKKGEDEESAGDMVLDTLAWMA